MASQKANTRTQRLRKLKADPSDERRDVPNSETARRLKVWRQNLIAQLILTGTMTLEDMRAYLMDVHGYAISGGQLSKDIKAMKERWQAAALENTDTMIRSELNKLNELENTAIQGLRDAGKISDFVDIYLKIAKRRASLLGLDKAKKIEVSRGLENLSDAELEAVVLSEGEPNAEPE